MIRGKLPDNCCFRCQDYIAPPEDYGGRADMGLCKEGNTSEVVKVNERDCCKYFREREE